MTASCSWSCLRQRARLCHWFLVWTSQSANVSLAPASTQRQRGLLEVKQESLTLVKHFIKTDSCRKRYICWLAMGRTVEPRSWRSQPATGVYHIATSWQHNWAWKLTEVLHIPHMTLYVPFHGLAEASASLAEPSTSSGQWLAFRSRDTATTSWSSSSASVSGSSSALAIDQLRRSVLPASIPDAQNERINTAPWRVGTSTTSVSGLDRDSSSSRHIARPSGASWHAAHNDNGELPDSSSMLPPRLGTPVPRANNSNRQLFPTLAAPLSPAPNVVARPAGPSLDETLTSIGRRALARHRLSILESDSSGDQVSTLVHALNLETLERAQLAVEGSRIALEQARLAIRVALRNSETYAHPVQLWEVFIC